MGCLQKPYSLTAIVYRIINTGFHNIIRIVPIAQIAPIRLGDLGLDFLFLQGFLPATLHHTLNTL